MNTKVLNNKSRELVTALRHKPEILQLTLNGNGWADVNCVLNSLEITKEELDWIVETNNKKRFEYNDDQTMIRASQGHSIDVNLEKDWVEFIPEGPLYHGTSSETVSIILKEGLKSMSRTHVHLSKDIETAVKVGSRKGKVVVLEVDARWLRADGGKLFESANGVILTNAVDPKYIKQLS